MFPQVQSGLQPQAQQSSEVMDELWLLVYSYMYMYHCNKVQKYGSYECVCVFGGGGGGGNSFWGAEIVKCNYVS